MASSQKINLNIGIEVDLKEDLKNNEKWQEIFGDWQQEKCEIEVQHPGLKIERFIEICNSRISKTNLESLDDDKLNKEIYNICDNLMTYEPENFEDLILYYKTVCAIFISFHSNVNSFTLKRKMNLLHRAFTIDIQDWYTNPVIMHLICKSLIEALQKPKNTIYFARKISSINQTSFYISVCLMWSTLFQISKIELTMNRLYKLKTLHEILESSELDENNTILNDLYMILEIISFLQNAIIHRNNNTENPYNVYFEYSTEDLLKMKAWCKNTLKIFRFDVGARSLDYSHINDLIEFDILHMLEKKFPQKTSIYFEQDGDNSAFT